MRRPVRTDDLDNRIRRGIERAINCEVERVMHFEIQPQDPSGEGPYGRIPVKVRVSDRCIIIEGGTQGSGRWFATGNTHQTVESAVAQFARQAVKAGFIREAQQLRNNRDWLRKSPSTARG